MFEITEVRELQPGEIEPVPERRDLPRYSMLTVEEVAADMRLSIRKVRQLIASGELVARKVGGSVRVLADEYDEFKRALPLANGKAGA